VRDIYWVCSSRHVVDIADVVAVADPVFEQMLSVWAGYADGFGNEVFVIVDERFDERVDLWIEFVGADCLSLRMMMTMSTRASSAVFCPTAA